MESPEAESASAHGDVRAPAKEEEEEEEKGDADPPDDDNGDDDPPDRDFDAALSAALSSLLSRSRSEVDAAERTARRKRTELAAAEAEARRKAEEADRSSRRLREAARSIGEDGGGEEGSWRSMYARFLAWREGRGARRPRRNWKAKVDAEEKALGKWSFEQRRDEREGKLDPLKKAMLERIGFSFLSVRDQRWEDFRESLKDFVRTNGQLTDNIADPKLKEANLYDRLVYYRKCPKMLLGELDYVKGDRSDCIRQDKVDFLTECGMKWNLTREQAYALKEKGLTFPLPAEEEGAGPTLEGGAPTDKVRPEDRAWRAMFEALCEFKRKTGHTYVTAGNSSEELYHWVDGMRRKMRMYEIYRARMGDRDFLDYQREMLGRIGFLYAQADLDWMEQCERMAGYKMLFGTAAVTDKYASFERLLQWADENKRMDLGLPAEESGWTKAVTIPWSVRKRLLDELGVLDVQYGDENVETLKSNCQFKSAEQVIQWEIGVMQSLRDKRRADIRKCHLPWHWPVPPSGSIDASLERSEPIRIDPKKERDFFLARGVVVLASVAERVKLGESATRKRCSYRDGRPLKLCRIAGCNNLNRGSTENYLCFVHFNMTLLLQSRGNPNEEAVSAAKTAKEGTGESMKLFRRCGGPLAATAPDRGKLLKRPLRVYGDERTLSLCRVAGCQTKCSDSAEKRYLCDRHFDLVTKETRTEGVILAKRKRKKTFHEAFEKRESCTLEPIEAAKVLKPHQSDTVQNIPEWHKPSPIVHGQRLSAVIHATQCPRLALPGAMPESLDSVPEWHKPLPPATGEGFSTTGRDI